MTKTEAILQAMKTLANQALVGVKVERSRTSTFGESELPALNIKPGEDEVLNYAQQLNKHEFNVTCELYLPPQNSSDQAADPYVEALHQAIANSATLPAIVSDVHYKSRVWQFEDADGSASKLLITYQFIYLNPSNTL